MIEVKNISILHNPAFGLSSRSTIAVCLCLFLGSAWSGSDVSAQETASLDTDPPWEVIDSYCTGCHNFEDWAGEVSFDTMNREHLEQDSAVWEAAVLKLRTGLMPPSGEPRPHRAVLDEVALWLETELDAAETQNPGAEGLSRLNRAEYINSIRDLLAFDPGKLVDNLPQDFSVGGFDNIADGLAISPTLLESYIAIAMEISRHAVGDRTIGATDIHYTNSRGIQKYHINGQPLGTRGGMNVEHNFPVDAEYVFRVYGNIQEVGWGNVEHRMWWCRGPAVDVSFNGVRVEVEDYRNFRFRVPAGPQTIAVAMVDDHRCAGVGELYLGEALASVGGSIQEIEIQGPFNPAETMETPSRRAIFICQPETSSEETACAHEILSNLATRAYRRPVQTDSDEVSTLMNFYTIAREEEGGDFELGIQYALSRLLVDPRFLFRFEDEPTNLADGEIYAINDFELASRLSFFLWSSIPDLELLNVAAEGRLSNPQVLAAQVDRMLQDDLSRALVENFAGQWLKLRDLADVAPQDPDFDEELRRSFRQETELLFASLLQEERSVMDLLDANYTFVNERSALHYGIEGVRGSYMRRVELPENSPRRGLLGQGSLLTTTSIPNRTSPVVRGVWIVESILGAPVPQPPAGVEVNLEPEVDNEGNLKAETLRERLEQHRTDQPCFGCHGIMDPVGLALENFDLSGRWRDEDGGVEINAESELVDGTQINGPVDLRQVLLSRRDAFLNSLTNKLLTYALGRETEYFDQPAIRKIVRQAASKNYTLAALIQGIAASDPFQKRIKLAPDAGESFIQLSEDLAATAQPEIQGVD